jgi:hypothetical protein
MTKKHLPSNKILIMLPFWAGDRNEMIDLARLLADLQPGHSDDFDVLFVARFDCPQVDSATINHVSRKFNVLTHTSKRRDTGWPMGCNGTFFGSLEYVYHKATYGHIPGYKALFNCASDSCPISIDCFAYLHREWEKANKKRVVTSAGALVPDGGKEHINGDATLLSGNISFLRWLAVEVGGMRASVGWDFGLARDFEHRGWANIPGIRSFWGTQTMPAGTIEHHAKRGIVWIHGVKDASVRDWARKNLL